MSDGTGIEWTDATWNPVRGCTKVSPGCKHCYAETFAERFRGVPGQPFEHGFDLRLVPNALELPKTWRRSRLVFVNSMSDLFHEDVPDDYIRFKQWGGRNKKQAGRVIDGREWDEIPKTRHHARRSPMLHVLPAHA